MRITNNSPFAQIGGNSWAVENSSKQCVVLDYGVPLSYREFIPGFPHRNSGFEAYLEAIGLIPHLPADICRTDSVKILLSHPHYDHYGSLWILERAGQSYRLLLPEIRMQQQVEWIMGAGFSSGTISAGDRVSEISDSILHAEGFSVMCHKVQHTVPMSYSIELHNPEGKCVLYTGDFLNFIDDRDMESIVRRTNCELALITEGTYVGEPNPTYTEEQSIEQLTKIHASRPEDYFVTSVTSSNVGRTNLIAKANEDNVVFDHIFYSELLKKGCTDMIDVPRPKRVKSLSSLRPGDILIRGAGIDREVEEDLEWWMNDEQASFLSKNKGRVHFFFLRDVEFHPPAGTYADIFRRYLQFHGVHAYYLDIRGHASSSSLFTTISNLETLCRSNSVTLSILPTHTKHPEVFAKWFPKETHILRTGETFDV